jgi:hypothetical protein
MDRARQDGVQNELLAELWHDPMVHDALVNVYTQVLDGSVRDAAEKIGDELSTIVHRPEQAGAVTVVLPEG